MEGTADRSGGPPPEGVPDTDETVVSPALPPTVATSPGALVPYIPSPGHSTEQAIVHVTRLVLGAIDLAAAAFATILERSTAVTHSGREGAATARPGLSRLPLAAVGLGLETQRRGLEAAAAVHRRAAVALAITTRSMLIRGASNAVQRRLDDLNRRGLAEQHENRQAARVFIDVLVTELATSVLDRVNVDAIVERVDLDELVRKLDLDEVVARLDVDAIVNRLDMGAVIRESTSTMTDETVEELRIQGMKADRALGRVVDRLLRRQSSPP
jgi:hypothetical protein